MPNIVLGVSGSVAAVRWPRLALALLDAGHAVAVVFTHSASRFALPAGGVVAVSAAGSAGTGTGAALAAAYDPPAWSRLVALLSAAAADSAPGRPLTAAAEPVAAASPARLRLFTDADEWAGWDAGCGNAGGARLPTAPVLHIALRDWAAALVLAPLSAHSLASLAGGLAGGLLAALARAWRFDKPLVLAPAMNAGMWEHPITRLQLAAVTAWAAWPGAVTLAPPVVKRLACGDEGAGALAPDADILAVLSSALAAAAAAREGTDPGSGAGAGKDSALAFKAAAQPA